MDMNQYLSLFIEEGHEHLQNLNQKMLVLEENPGDIQVINDIFRSAHTLKGMAGSMGYQDMADLTHKMENVLDDLRNQKMHVNESVIDVMFNGIDHLEKMVQQIEEGGSDARDVKDTVRALEALANGETPVEHSADKEGTSAKESSLKLTDYETSAAEAAAEQGLNVYSIRVELDERCILKAARAYMVFNALEGLGDVIKTEPSSEQIENEDFELAFECLFITSETSASIKEKILNVSEVSRSIVENYTADKATESVPENDISGESKDKPEAAPVQTKKPVAQKSIRVSLDRLDNLLNLFEELIIDRSRLEKLTENSVEAPLKEAVDKITRISNQLQETILNLRMEPIEQVFNRFPRMVRSLSKELNKTVHLKMEGKETEIDRTVIEEIGDPLVHLLRNSLDHGVETPEVRQEKGKDPEGQIYLRAYHSGNHVYIEIEDDGGGIDPSKIASKAINQSMISENEAEKLSDEEIFQYMFKSGFSTAEKVSDISGRGVGLDVVKSKIESLNGKVSVRSELNKGTTFTIQLPLTLSIIHAMMVGVGTESYAIPINSIEETLLLRQIQIKKVNQKRVMAYRDRIVPFVDLREYLEVPEPVSENGKGSVIIVKKGDNHLALICDQLMGHQDIVIKPLGSYLKQSQTFSGATILGDGSIALILDCQMIG